MTIQKARSKGFELRNPIEYTSDDGFYIETLQDIDGKHFYLNNDMIFRTYNPSDDRVFFKTEEGAFKAIEKYKVKTISLHEVYNTRKR